MIEILILISVVFVFFLIPMVPLILLFYLIGTYFRSTIRELKRKSFQFFLKKKF
jgi:hypothetical protein